MSDLKFIEIGNYIFAISSIVSIKKLSEYLTISFFDGKKVKEITVSNDYIKTDEEYRRIKRMLL